MRALARSTSPAIESGRLSERRLSAEMSSACSINSPSQNCLARLTLINRSYSCRAFIGAMTYYRYSLLKCQPHLHLIAEPL